MKSPARSLNFNRLTRKISKRRIAKFRESGEEFSIRCKSIINEMEEIYGSIENAPDLSEYEREKLSSDFAKENEAYISKLIAQLQSFLESRRTRKRKLRKSKKSQS